MLSDGRGELGALEAVELWQSEVALSEPIRAAHGVHNAKRVLYLRICTATSEGWSEVGALEAPVGTDPSLDEVDAHLRTTWIPKLVAASDARQHSCPASHSISLLGARTPPDLVASAALEAAILDAELRYAQQSLASWLGIERPSVPFGAVLGLDAASSRAELLERAGRALDAGASRLRIKVDPDVPLDHVRSLIEEFSDVAIHGDANGSFDRESAWPHLGGLLNEVDAAGLRVLEQPLSTNDLTVYRSLCDEMATPICLDEGLTSLARATNVVRYRAADAFCIKPARVGGVRQAVAILDVARQASIDCFIGGYFDTGLGRALLGALSALEGSTLVSDVAAPSTYLVDDPCGLEPPSGARQGLWSTPGVGPWPRREARNLVFRHQG